MLTIGELAKRSEVSVDTIRHYTQKGLLNAQRNADNGYHLYPLSHVKRVNFIRQAKSLGFSLNDIALILNDADQGRSPCQHTRHVINKKIKENRRRLDELQALQGRMEKALAQWSSLPNLCPDGESICHLIEATDDESEIGT